MIPEKELEALLRNRLHETMPSQKIDELVSEIKSLGDGWEEVTVGHRDMGYSMSVNCADICWFADHVCQGEAIRDDSKKRVAGRS